VALGASPSVLLSELEMELIDGLKTFHDAELRSVVHRASTELLELGFEKTDGRLVTVFLPGVQAFRVTDMRTQNVVSRLLVHGDNVRFSNDELVDRIGWMSRTCEGEQLLEAAVVMALVRKVTSGECLLLVLEPSWGAEMIVVAGKLVLDGGAVDRR
jgi:hypothetical protein